MPTKFETPALTADEHKIVPIASQELFDLAKNKGSELTTGTQIRLTAHEHSWTLFNYNGVVYIGREPGTPLKSFFKTTSREELNLTDKDGNVTYLVQRLFKR